MYAFLLPSVFIFMTCFTLSDLRQSSSDSGLTAHKVPLAIPGTGNSGNMTAAKRSLSSDARPVISAAIYDEDFATPSTPAGRTPVKRGLFSSVKTKLFGGSGKKK